MTPRWRFPLKISSFIIAKKYRWVNLKNDYRHKRMQSFLLSFVKGKYRTAKYRTADFFVQHREGDEFLKSLRGWKNNQLWKFWKNSSELPFPFKIFFQVLGIEGRNSHFTGSNSVQLHENNYGFLRVFLTEGYAGLFIVYIFSYSIQGFVCFYFVLFLLKISKKTFQINFLTRNISTVKGEQC